MRYLYADSEPFPLEYDFLATLRGFLECGATCLGAVASIETQDALVDTEKANNERQHLALDRYAKDALGGLESAHGSNPLKEAIDTAHSQMEESLRRTVASAKDTVDGSLRQVEQAARSRIDGQGETIRNALERFLLKERLEVEDTFFELTLENDGYVISAMCRMPEGLSVQYQLDARRRDEWTRPRKVSEIAGELQIQVGMKKKMFAKNLSVEHAKVGDWALVAATLGATRASITLRKRPDSDKDTTIITLRRTESGVRGDVRRGVELGQERESMFPTADEDASHLAELWDNLEGECRATLAHRDSVRAIRLDGEDILEGTQVTTFVERYVKMYTPIVEQIAKRSPSSKELSLKVEHADGKREEIYLRREDLADVVAPLDDQQMKVFAPLDFFPTIDIDFD